MPQHPGKKKQRKKAASKRVSETIRKERKKGTKPKKAVAIGLSVERQRKRKGATFE